MVHQIVDRGVNLAAQAAAAAQVTHARLTDDELQAWRQDLEARLDCLQQHPEQNLGFIEEHLARAAKEPLRLLAQRAAQAKANATPCRCPNCQDALADQKYLPRHLDSRFGRWELWRRYGRCPQCETWHFPADHALGLGKQAPASPYLQEMAALLVSKMPPEQAVLVAERMGLTLSRCPLDREAHRQGRKAQDARTAALAQLDTSAGLQSLNPPTEGPPAQPFTLVIEIDAWNIRERDDWGQTEQLRAQGQPVSRWHWVYTGTVFRLDQRAQTAGGRALISQRADAVTRLGVEALRRQLYYEARRGGLGQAQDVLFGVGVTSRHLTFHCPAESKRTARLRSIASGRDRDRGGGKANVKCRDVTPRHSLWPGDPRGPRVGDAVAEAFAPG